MELMEKAMKVDLKEWMPMNDYFLKCCNLLNFNYKFINKKYIYILKFYKMNSSSLKLF